MPSRGARFFAELARLLDAGPNVGGTLESLTCHTVRALGCDHAAVVLLHGRGHVETVAATHPVVEKAHALQDELGEGPCLQSVWDDETFTVADLGGDERWPRWGPKAADLGLRSMLSVRLFSRDRTHGSLNAYSASVRRFDDEDVATAQILATHACVVLAARRREENLRRAVDSRHLVGLAQGILMERFDIDADTAFEVLRRYSQDENVKLRRVAEDVVTHRRLPVANGEKATAGS